MLPKTLVGFSILAAVVVGAALFLPGGREESGLTHEPALDHVIPGSAGLVIGANAIYVAEPAPSPTLSVAAVRLAQPGFVVVHEDASGARGEVLGASGLLAAGETKNLAPIRLARMTRNGETLYVVLHLDDGDGAFDVAKDKPALDPVGNLPVMMIVSVSAAATAPGAVSW